MIYLADAYFPMRSTYTVADQRLLEHLFRIHGKPEKGYGNTIKYYRKIAKIFNSMTTGEKRTPYQVRNYHGYQKKRASIEEPKTCHRANNKSSTRTKNSASALPSNKDRLSILPPPPPPPPSSTNEITCKNIRCKICISLTSLLMERFCNAQHITLLPVNPHSALAIALD